jgi:hypothetical protein
MTLNVFATQGYVASQIASAAGAVTTSSQSGNYVLALTDAGTVIQMENTAAATLTVPPSSSVNFPVGTVLEVDMMAAGTVTFTPGAGVTLLSASGYLVLSTQYEVCALRKTDTDTWLLVGGLAAS